MADEKKVTEQQEQQEQENGKYLVKFGKPYQFEGKEYDSVDISGVEKLKVKDAMEVQKRLFNAGETATLGVIETTTAFACAVAAKAAGLPIEFFQLMPRGPMRKLRTAVRDYMNADAAENHVMKLEAPYQFGGKTYTEIDLAKLADMNALNESTAENKLTVEGYMVTDTRFNYYYACVMASMATGLPEEFFTGLPLCEASKLKNAVNDPDFFE